LKLNALGIIIADIVSDATKIYQKIFFPVVADGFCDESDDGIPDLLE